MSKSTFHLKGNGWVGLEDFVREHVPGGMSGVLERLPDDASRAFLQQTFITSAWYDIMPLIPITTACAQLKRSTHGAFMREWAGYQATRDANGIYRFLLKMISPEMVVSALPRTARRYFDFVTTEVKRTSPRDFELDVSGIPEALADVYSPVTEVFITRALETAGARSVRVTTSPPKRTGLAHGVAIVRFDRQITWA